MRAPRPSLLGWLCCVLAGAASAVHAEEWEEPPPLVAEQLLGPSSASGSHYTIERDVESDGLMNRYVIGSSFQKIDAYGDSLALERAREQSAMAGLREIKTTDAYAQGLAAALEAPLALTKEALTDPMAVMKSAPAAVNNLVSDVTTAIGAVGRGRGNGSTRDTLKELMGFQKVKARLAHEMGVDVYSSNPVLQQDLDDVAWSIFAGGASIDLAMTQAPMAASLSVSAAEHLHAARSGLWQVPPATLLGASSEALQEAGLSQDEAEEVAWHSTCTLTHQTYLASAMALLEGVAGRDAFLRQAAEASDEDACRQYAETARLLWSYHTERRPIRSLAVADGIVTFTDADGRSVLPLRADYVFWTPEAGRLVAALPTTGQRAVWVSGATSKRTRAALGQRGITLHDRVFARHERDVDVAAVLASGRTVAAPPPSAPEAAPPATEKKRGILGGLGSGWLDRKGSAAE